MLRQSVYHSHTHITNIHSLTHIIRNTHSPLSSAVTAIVSSGALRDATRGPYKHIHEIKKQK